VCFALNLATKLHDTNGNIPLTIIQFNSATNNIGSPDQISVVGTVGGTLTVGSASCQPYGYLAGVTYTACAADAYLGTGNALFEDELFAFTAQSVGLVYWNFLHLLGYYDVASIPAKCIIPTPNVALQGVPYQELEGANATFLLNLYLTYLNQLGFTYNATDFVLNTTTFCNHPLPAPSGNFTGQFNVYGLGYIFLNGSSVHSANGSVVQTLGDPTSWNVSGEVFIQPSLYNMTVPVNTTWFLSSKQGAWAFVVPLVNTTSGKTIGSAPTTCVNGGKCYTPWAAGAYYLGAVGGGLFGNSTLKGGGPTKGTPSVRGNDAIFFTECWTNSANNSTPDFKSTSTCGFGVGGITPPPPPCSGSSCQCKPPNCGHLGGSSPCAGDSIYLVGPAVDSIAGFIGFGNVGCLVAWAIIILLIVAVIALAIGIVTFIVGRRD